MKIYLSADIEGITGVTSWDGTPAGKSDYIDFRQQMIREVSAASESQKKFRLPLLMEKSI